MTHENTLTSTAAEAAAPQPEDVRMDEVNRLRAAIASGTYTVSAEALAGKILDHLYEPDTEKL